METRNLSIIIITHDEELNLPRCLASLPKGAEVIVVDSFSSDRTCQIAEDYGAKVYQRPFKNHRDQKNYAISLTSKPWILALDADEQWCGQLPDLAASKVDGFRLHRQLIFMGKKMRFGKTRDMPLRLFRKDRGQYTEAIHEEVKLVGRVGKYGKAHLLHYSYLDLSDYFERFNRYTSLVAENHWQKGHSVSTLPHLLRPWFEFFSRYFLRLGILDGRPGYTYALLSSLYAYVKYEKLHEKSHLHG